MVPFAQPPAAVLSGKQIIIANGRRDPMATASHTRRLVDQFSERGALVSEVPHDGGHAVDPRGVEQITRRLAGR